MAFQREIKMEMEEGSNFPEDIVAEILCRLPKKSLARLKCVSRQWLVLISDWDRVHPKTTKVGLVCQSFINPFLYPTYRDTHERSRMALLHVDHKDKGRACQDCSVLRNSVMERQRHGFLISSCNGFLLFYSQLELDDTKYEVYYPTANRSWHIFPPKPHNVSSCAGLASYGNRFKVVCITFDDDRRNIGSLVYSSQNQEWLEESPPHSVPIPSQPWSSIVSERSVFVRGSLHWIWSHCLLICHLQDGHCEFLSLPRVPGSRRRLQTHCIWESEGSLNYCNVSCGDRIGIWTLRWGNWSSKRNRYSFRWKVKHRGLLAPPFAVIEKRFSLISPVAFNDDFAIVYLEYKRKIFSYNLATEEVKEACVSPFEGSDFGAPCTVLPFLYVNSI